MLYSNCARKLLLLIQNREDNKKASLSYLKESALTRLYDLYFVLKYPETFNDDFVEQRDAVKSAMLKILTTESNEEIINILTTEIYENVLLKINNELFFMDNRDFGEQDFYIEKNKECEESLMEMVVADLKTSKKHLNLFWYSRSTRIPSFLFKKVWEQSHPNCELRHYMYYDQVQGAHLLTPCGSENPFSQAKRFLCGFDHGNFRIDTKFDIGYLDFSCINSYTAFDDDLQIFKEDFFYINTHVKIGAPFIISIHDWAVSYEIIKFISYYLKDITVYKKENSKQYYIVGVATKNRNENLDNAHDLLTKILVPQEGEFYYDIFGDEEENVLFRSVYLTEDLANEVFNAHKAEIQNNYEQTLKLLGENVQEDTRRPLIPFSPGQLGLVLVSGDIDGIINEGDGHYHIIKGSVYRRPETVRTIENGATLVKTTNAVATSITVLLANGQMLSLR